MSRRRGTVVERPVKEGMRYALRFHADEGRQFQTLPLGTTREAAEAQLAATMILVERGLWRSEKAKTEAEPVSFHQFSSRWLHDRRHELEATTIADYEWALSQHLLPFFAGHSLSEITVQEVDRYRTWKLAEGKLGPTSINKTITRLSQVLGVAVEYGLVGANPAAGRRRRVKGVRPKRLWVEPEQLMALLEAAEKPTKLLAGRGRALLATLAGTGLRIDEALSLKREDINLVKATITVRKSKTDAGIRVVDMPPALRDELAAYLADSPLQAPGDLAFGTSTGGKQSATNVRRRLFAVAIERANVRLAELGIEPLGAVRPHGLRRTFASLRTAVGDDPVYISQQLGHVDVGFSLRVYAQAVKRRERMTEAEREQYARAVEWASWSTPVTISGTECLNGASDALSAVLSADEKSPA